jgi:hypothetical protein
MKQIFLALMLVSSWAWAQQPTPPPAGDIAPTPESPEGQKQIVPTPTKKGGHPKPMPGLPHKRPPVKPPTPEPTAPDQPQDGIKVR